jgi:hypothetical protein
MLKSFVTSRPHVVFEPDNVDHRSAYFTFLSTGRWANSPYRFILEEPYVDLPTCINTKMMRYFSKLDLTNIQKDC